MDTNQSDAVPSSSVPDQENEAGPASMVSNDVEGEERSEWKGGETSARIHFTNDAEQWNETREVSVSSTAGEIRQSLCGIWKLEPDELLLLYRGFEIENSQTFESLGIKVMYLTEVIFIFANCRKWLCIYLDQ